MEDETTPSPILRTKLNRPPVPSEHVHRTRLLDELEKGRERPLTLISAPAGYGKSTLASCWLAASDFPGAWLSLDERDNDLRLFLTYFLEAIRTLFPTALQKTVALLKAGSLPPVSVLAASLLNELEGVEQEFILVLDDFHRIEDPSVLELLAEVLRYPAEPMHLVLAGRRDPFLPMSNLRARGLVTEIRAQGLRFTTQETAAFLHGALADRVEEATAAAWAEKTEGWVTGLRLAALSLCHQADAGAKMLETVGSSRYLTEYFYEEVLARQTTDVRQHLLRSSILDRFCAPLCDALYEAGIEPGPPEIDGQGFITWLQENNLFLIPQDLENRWFRYHHLFRSLLQDQLNRRRSPEEISAAHRRASYWFEEKGLVDEAIRHSLASGDVSGACQVIERNRYDALNEDKWFVVSKWLAQIPAESIQQSAGLLFAKVWVLNHQFRLLEIPPLIERIESLFERETAEQVLHGELCFFKGFLLFWEGQIDRSIEFFRKAQDLVPREEKYDLIRGDNELYCAMALQMEGQGGIAIQELNEEIGSHRTRKGMYFTRLVSSPCFVHMLSGDLRQAEEASVQLGKASGRTELAYANTWSNYMQACCCFHAYDLERAHRYFAAAVEQRYIMHNVQAMCSLAGLALTHQGLGRAEEAREAMEELLAFAHETDDPVRLSIARSSSARLSTLQGDLETALNWQRSFHEATNPSSFFVWLELPAVTQCRVLIAVGSDDGLKKAVKGLESLLEVANEIHNTFHRIDLLALQTLALYKLSRIDESLKVMEQALNMAMPGGWIRPFVEPGPQMADLLKQLKTEKEDTLFIDQILAAFGEDEERVAPKASDAQPAPAPPTTAQPLIEPMTIRELETLELVNQGMYNKEIADKLSISPETVKSHLRNIYQKLGVGGRRQAVHRARTLDILPRL